jgi:Tol biopolymer transport system component
MKFKLWLLLLILFAIELACSKSDKAIGPEGPTPVWYDSDADWSPDGNSIIFIRVGNPLEGRKGGIFNYSVSDSMLSPFFFLSTWNLSCPRYSPDGNRIIYSYFGDLYLMNLPNTSPIQITFKEDIYFPDWCPDGRRIAYHDFRGDERGAYIMDLETRNLHPLSQLPEYYECPVWFPDGNSLAVISYKYEGAPQIVRVDTLGNEIAKLTDTPTWKYHIDICYETGKICFSQQYAKEFTKLWIMNLDGTSLRKLVKEDSDYPAFSPDGKWIAYTHTADSDGSLWAIRPDGSDKHRLTNFMLEIQDNK